MFFPYRGDEQFERDTRHELYAVLIVPNPSSTLARTPIYDFV